MTNLKISGWNKLLWAIAPRWMAKRTYARVKGQLAHRMLLASSTDTPYRHWRTVAVSPNAMIDERSKIAARATLFYHDNPFVRSAVDICVDKITGASPQATTNDDSFNKSAEDYFNRWAEVADYYGQYSFAEIERTITLKPYLDGGCFVRKIIRDDIKFPFSLEVLEYNRLAPSGSPKGNNFIYNGAEIDTNSGRIVAYHFYKFDPNDQSLYRYNNRITRVPVEQLYHISSYRRPGQILGLPILTPSIPFAGHLNEILEAELLAKKVEAFLAVFIKESDSYTRFNMLQTNEMSGKKEIELTPGMVEHLLPGEELQVVDPKRPGSNFKDFFGMVLQGIGRPLGLSKEQISGDKSETNYSSARHSELELRERIIIARESNLRNFLAPLWREVVTYGIDFGQIKKPPDYSSNRDAYLKHRWIFRGFAWVDPLKEAKAKQQELIMGLTTLADEASSRGKDWEELIKQRAKEIETLKKLGITDISEMGAKNGNQG